MAERNGRIAEIEADNERLRDEVERYRRAMEDALQQVDWCIGYFVGNNKGGLAKSLGANRAHIRKQILRRSVAAMPIDEDGTTDESE
jgi:hypothetical protein